MAMPILSQLQSAANPMLQVFLKWESSYLVTRVSGMGYLEGSGPTFNSE